jgi:hypothetical protein
MNARVDEIKRRTRPQLRAGSSASMICPVVIPAPTPRPAPPPNWHSRTVQRRLLVAGLTAIAVAATFALCRDLRHDDAFITFQYARNIATGAGFVFNPGERILGVTSPLHTLLLAVVGLAGGDLIPAAGVLLGALALGAQALFMAALLWEESPRWAVALGLLTFCGLAGAQTWLALETNLLAALVLGTLWSARAGRRTACGVLLGLAFLCRYDAALLIPIVGVQTWCRERRVPRRELLVAFAVVAPWLLWSTWYFGSCVPTTLSAKSGQTPAGQYVAHYAELFAFGPRPTAVAGRLGGVALAVFAALIGAGVVFAVRHVRALLGFLAFGAALLLTYAAIGPIRFHHWHMYPAELAARVACVVGLLGWAEVGARAVRGRWSRVLGAAVLAATALLVLGTAWHTIAWTRSFQDDPWLGRRHRDYTVIAAWVTAEVAPGSSFLADEVGTLGFLTRYRMIDPGGLVTEFDGPRWDYTRPALLARIRRFAPDLILVDNPEQGVWLERVAGYRIVMHFPWRAPRSTLLIRAAQVLRRPEDFPRLRREVARELGHP